LLSAEKPFPNGICWSKNAPTFSGLFCSDASNSLIASLFLKLNYRENIIRNENFFE